MDYITPQKYLLHFEEMLKAELIKLEKLKGVVLDNSMYEVAGQFRDIERMLMYINESFTKAK